MLHDAILTASKLFHKNTDYNLTYDAFFRTHPVPELTMAYADDLITFINSWATRSPLESIELYPALRHVWPHLDVSQEFDLLHSDADDLVGAGPFTLGDLVHVCFDTIAASGTRYEATGASKILHMINPKLFVMWDAAIAKAYNCTEKRRHGFSYAAFFRRSQQQARRAIGDYVSIHGVTEDEALRMICGCGHTLPKVLDEFNYGRHTSPWSEVVNDLL